MFLHNRVNKKELKARLQKDEIKRRTISFYRYVKINEPSLLRDILFKKWSELNCLGRIYLAHEGINAQMSIPVEHFEIFKNSLYADERFAGTPLKLGVEDNGKSFYKLTIKVRDKVVADGINDPEFDPSNTGKYLQAKEFNETLSMPGTIVIDMRNHYESEVGHFEGAVLPDSDTFREELPKVVEMLKGKEDQKILMYCTGGIRCEKASAYMKYKGFNEVYHLYGGIIEYARQIKEQNIPSKFIGKNFVFDERLGERITEDVIARCHQCDAHCDNHTNCANDDCHLLFIQCEECKKKYNNCCSHKCMDIAALPIEEQRKLRRGRIKEDSLSVYKSRLRPNLKEILKQHPGL